MERQTVIRRIAGRGVESVVCQLKGGYGCKHKSCNGTAKTRTATGGSLRKGNKMFKCQDCGKLTHDSTYTGLGTMCRDCYDDAGIENEHSDGHHDDVANPDCKDCNALLQLADNIIEERAHQQGKHAEQSSRNCETCIAEYAASLTLVPSDTAIEAFKEQTEPEHNTVIMHYDPGYIVICICNDGKEFLHSEYPLARTAAEAWSREHLA